MKWQIPYDGQVLEFDDLTLTANEARRQKRLTADPDFGTPGMSPHAADKARQDLDGDAWMAALNIAWTRAGRTLPVDGFDLDKLDVKQIHTETLTKLRADRAAEGVDVDAVDPDGADDAAQDPPADEPAPVKPKARRSATS